MLYIDYITKAKELTIGYDEVSMFYYLEPDWQTILYENNMSDLEAVPDMRLEGWYDLEDVLKLEVEKRNAKASKLNIVLNWIGDVISSTLDPAMVDEENDLVQSMIELAKAKNQQAQKPD